ncbi:MAG: hypothetical protein AAB776_02735 [Patescibacteria group bacterium]
MQRLAELLAPYDEYTRDLETVDVMMLFELMDLEGCFNSDFAANLEAGAVLFNEYLNQEAMTPKKQREHLRLMKRFNRSVQRMMMHLRDNGFMLTSKVFNEMLAFMQHLQTQSNILEDGLDVTRSKRDQVAVLYGQTPQEIGRGILDFGWYELATRLYRASRTNMKPIQGMDDARALLRTVEIAHRPGIAVTLPRMSRKTLGLEEYVFRVAESRHPLSLGRLLVFSEHTRVMVADAEIARTSGDITFESCLFLPVSAAFQTMQTEKTYALFRDLVTFNIYELLMQGTLQERTYICPDGTTEDVTEDEADKPVATMSAEPETSVAATVEEPEIDPEAASLGIIGRSRFGYRNIVAHLFHFGVSMERGGKHLRLRLGDRTTTFLNRHRQENPRHNKAVLRRALDALGIPQEEFFSTL